MFILKFILFISLFVYYVKSDNVIKKINKDATSKNEPSVEIHNIPVVVVLEEENRKGKSADINVSKIISKNDLLNHNDSKSTTEISETKTDKPTINSDSYNKSTQVEKNSEDKSININNSSSKDSIIINTVSNTETEIRIPIAIIYDPEPENLLSLHKTQSNQKRQSRRKDIENKNRTSLETRAKLEMQSEGQNMSRKFSKRIRERDPVVPIVQSENYVFSHNGEFHYSYEGGDGTKAFEKGELKSIDDNTGESVVGSFSYVGKDGNEYSLTYTADENGYRPVGAHLPTPPPIPPAIARALKYLATKSTPEPVTESLK
ncbi:unnamed protein product [Diatraea saccharalis]|uniref:Endocuticle structural glycoprotein SgAbd-3 n=1 Tax=Diatraea saccharalis TaxID=40085 RepID=A0A9N9QX51_9NEOP|nr:unnamed protein product [Diatraea saccharalis]